MTMTQYKAIKIEVEFGNVLKIILNRPKRKNAFNKDVRLFLVNLLKQFLTN